MRKAAPLDGTYSIAKLRDRFTSTVHLLRFILSAIGVPMCILAALGFMRDSRRLLGADRETTRNFIFAIISLLKFF